MSVNDGSSTDWQRVSPIAILYFIASTAIKAVKDFALNMAPAVIALMVTVDNKLFWLSVVAVASGLLILVGAVLFYRTYRFRILGDEVIVHRGIFNQQNIGLKFNRIQNVNITTPIYFAPFGLVKCSFDSAGSTGSDINIPGVHAPFAAALNRQILAYQTQTGARSSGDFEAETPSDEGTAETAAGDPYLRLGTREAAGYGLVNNMAFVAAAITFPLVLQFGDNIGIDYGIAFRLLLETMPAPGLVGAVLTSLVLGFVIAFGLLLLSCTASFVTYYKLALYDEGDRLKRFSGLLERRQIAVKKHKIQGVSVIQNMFARLLGRVTIRYRQIETGPVNGQPKRGTTNFKIPMVRTADWRRYITLAYPDFPLDQTFDFQPVNSRFILKNILLFSLPILATTAAMVWGFGWKHLLWLSLMPVMVLSVLQIRARYGLWIGRDFAVIREGFLGVRYTVIPLYKIQQAGYEETPLQARRGLRHLRLQLAFRRLTIPYLPEAYVNAFINRVVAAIEMSDKKWP